jgi:hypothetical protein
MENLKHCPFQSLGSPLSHVIFSTTMKGAYYVLQKKKLDHEEIETLVQGLDHLKVIDWEDHRLDF